ncbi:unnamed protein product [Tilletia controversa]|uniref:Uncharacterized protein n=3 Tax=Tilletia TaxID=13289 RepID=A0A8X7STI1_9BASI|nr:hypothetical protein CF328_g7764 [Tilletia controversa]KAE8188902.1 hypothetical protein CF336_g5963 [Tilletia laevis]KAE8256890.1 hypothetical protein A4X03_0g4957 [Tilletia caries]KAE8194440.1 hypothetical protein CF335_g5348 [Tilletia laevis]KAE8239760.1 hypothetical protein A4X06_0g8059 [Tilletia controversa]
MRFSTIIIALALAASSTFAGLVPTAVNTDPVARALTKCDPDSENFPILAPKWDEKLHWGKDFLFSFCALSADAAYTPDETSYEILVGFESENGHDAELIAVNLKPGEYTKNLTAGGTEVYEETNKTLVVYEVRKGPHNKADLITFRLPVTVLPRGH